jgi:hypothetical protein
VFSVRRKKMNVPMVKTCTTLLAGFLFSSQAVAVLTIEDAGVVGTIEGGPQAANVATVTPWAQFLLDQDNGYDDTVSGIHYTTRTTPPEYDGTLTGGTRIDGSKINITGFEWVLGKYDGQNAGYVLFNVSDWGGATIPEYSYSIWGNNAEQYQLSNITGWGGTPVPEPSTLLLLGVGIAGVGFASCKKKSKATAVA